MCSSDLENISVDGATGLIINVTGGPDLTAFEVNEATTLIMEAAHEDAEIIFGSVIDENMKNKVKITVIATGIGANAAIEHVFGAGASSNIPTATLSQERASIFGSANPSVVAHSSSVASNPMANTQAATLSSVANQVSAQVSSLTAPSAPVSAMPSVQPPPPPVIPEVRPVVPPPVATAPVSSLPRASSIENIIPSASMAEVDARMDAQAPVVTDSATPSASFADDFEDFGAIEEEILPKPGLLSQAAPSPTNASVVSRNASGMEQAELFEPKPEVKQEENLAARTRDSRAESIAKAQHIARSLGVGSLTDDEYDIPTFIRRQQQNNNSLS